MTEQMAFVKAMQRRGYIWDADGGFSRVPNDLHELVRNAHDWPDFGIEADVEIAGTVLRAEPGDTVVVTARIPITQEEARFLREEAERRLPGCEVLVLSECDIALVAKKGA